MKASELSIVIMGDHGYLGVVKERTDGSYNISKAVAINWPEDQTNPDEREIKQAIVCWFMAENLGDFHTMKGKADNVLTSPLDKKAVIFFNLCEAKMELAKEQALPELINKQFQASLGH